MALTCFKLKLHRGADPRAIPPCDICFFCALLGEPKFSSIPYLTHYETVRSASKDFGKLTLKILTRQKVKINLGRCATRLQRRWGIGPPEPACRSRLQTTLSCFGKEPWW